MHKKTIVERNIAENVKLRKRRIAEIKIEEKNITANCLMNTLLISKVQVICTKSYARQKVNGVSNKYF